MKEKLEEVHYTAYRLRDEIIFLTNNVYGNDWLTKAQRAKIIYLLDCAIKNIIKLINYLELELDKKEEENDDRTRK